ncbi:MAG: hypothetical protein EAZ51_02780 [Sphingobacteriales bacterium]|nr:MAG: hypothetical protein EAZ64_05370 [Sphingobacteriales bacterium]TAF82311.1 MAG: hypothetical protein EAZ51_02780 [Sphingobacteriales bacterium]
MSSSKKIFGGLIWSVLYNFINAIYGFISVPILLTVYGKEQYGIIGLAMSINVYLRLMDMGLSSGNVKFFSSFIVKNDKVQLKKAFSSSLVLYLIIGFVNLCLVYLISVFSDKIFTLNIDQKNTLDILLYILMITSFGSWVSSSLEQFIRANDLLGWQQRIILIPKVLQFFLIFIALYFELDLIIYFALTTLSVLLPLPIYVFKIKKINSTITFTPKYYKDVFNSVLLYSISIFSFSIFQFSANYLRPLILGAKVGIESVADYRILEGFANVILIVGTSFVGVILPTASKIRALDDKNKELQIAFDGTKYISIFLASIIFGFVLVSKEFIQIYVGKSYLHLVVWLNVWIISLLSTHISALSGLVLTNNNLKKILYMSGISTVISLILAWFLVGYFKVGGVVIGYTIYTIMQLLFYYIYYYPKVMHYDTIKLLKNSFLKPVLPIFLIFIFLFFVEDLIVLDNLYLKIIIIELIFAVLIIPIIYFKILNTNDKLFIFGLIKK